ncbi:MAG: PulJ/GspJ family protein [Thermoguttaceae bacterium]
MSAANRRPPKSRLPRHGFTLLEVVIAAMLVAVLMAAVYQVFFIYRKMFERGETQTEELQLVRTLTQQLSDDLAGAIQDPVFIDPKSRGPSGARRFGLYGTSTELRIDVLQIPAFQVARPPAAEEPDDQAGPGPRRLQAPELRTVYYTFNDTASADSSLPDGRVGLIRRELDFETPEKLEPSAGTDEPALVEAVLEEPVLGQSAVDVQAPAGPTTAELSGSTFDQILEVGMDHSVMWAPEVMSVRFRYFDGSRWRGSWDSLARKGLPVAVEMRLAVVPLEEADAARGTVAAEMAAPADAAATAGNLLMIDGTAPEGDPAEADEPYSEIDPLAGQAPAAVPTSGTASPKKVPNLHLHRVVIHLPNSPLQKELAAVKSQAPPTLEAPKLTTPAALGKAILQPAQPKARSPRSAPDQWMRNQ